MLGLIDGKLSRLLALCVGEEEITEIRLRVGRPLVCSTISERKTVTLQSGLPYIVTSADIDAILARASDFSVYAVNDSLCKGYLCKNGVRIGVAGEGVVEDGKLITIKNIKYLVLRIPHEIKGVSDKIVDYVLSDNDVVNTLIISPPCGGKTTMLRDLARVVSKRHNTLVIDERYELAAVEDGTATLDVGDSEVVSGIVKSVAYENCIRAMSPDVIITDEVFRKTEIDAVKDIIRSGVRVIASVHGESTSYLKQSSAYAELLGLFGVAVTLGKNPVGRLIGVNRNV